MKIQLSRHAVFADHPAYAIHVSSSKVVSKFFSSTPTFPSSIDVVEE